MNKSAENISKKQVLDLEDIKKILPHRHPFLMIDQIVELKGNKAVGIKNVRATEEYFKGHFPQRPVMPGVLIIEALAQVGGVIILSQEAHRGKLAYLVAVNKARFRKTVVPGDQLRLESEIIKIKSKIGVAKGVAKVDGEEVCEAEIMFALVE